MILGVDALMDMARTSINLVGNCLATVVMARWEGTFELTDENTPIADQLVYESGADLACAMSRKPEAVKVRAAIAARVLPAARRAALPEAVAPTPVLANDVRIDARLDRILGAVEALVGVVALLARPAAPPALALPAPVIAEAPAAPAALPAPRPVMPAAPATQTAVQTTTGRWLRPGQIAAVAQAELARETTAYAVGLAITALGLRGDATASRTSYISLPEGGEREVHSWCPTAQRLVIDYLRGQSPGRVRRNQEARDRRADIAEGAQQVLDGLGA